MRYRVMSLAVILSAVATILLPDDAAAAGKKTVLVFSRTKGFRHGDAIKDGNPILQEIAEELGYNCVISEDPAMFEPDTIKRWDCIIFNNTTGDIFPEAERRKAFIERIRAGAGFMGFHAATDCFYGFPEYGKMIGGYFDGHPWNQVVTARIEEPSHPLMRPFQGTKWDVKDEIYQFKNYERSAVRVLMSIDPRSVDINRGKRKDRDYALCWISKWGDGRVFYSAHGHDGAVFKMPKFRQHAKVAMNWACGDMDVDTTPSKVEDPAAAAARALQELSSSRNDDERSEALDKLSWRPHKDALPLLIPLLKPGAKLANEAAGAAVGIADGCKDIPDDTKIDALKKALDCTDNRSIRRQARSMLMKLGVTNLPISVPAGFIAHWWVAGPLPNEDMAAFVKAYPPESSIDIMKGFELDRENISWKKIITDDDGMVDLAQAVKRGNNIGAYMYAEVTVEKATPVELRLGSDDAFVIWLNGERIGGKKIFRGIAPAQDKFKTKLEAGTNRILMKILNGGSGWGGCLQIVGADGGKVDFNTRSK